MNHWCKTQDVISWFKRIQTKEKSSFTKFDIVDFYPLISKDMLTNAITFASIIANIDKKVTNTIMHSRKALLCSNNDDQILTLLWEAPTEQRYAS